MWKFAVLFLLVFAVPAPAQDPTDVERLERIEANTNRILSILAVHKGRIENIESRQDATDNKITALINAVAPNAKFTPSTQDEWGRGNAATFGTAMRTTSASYSSLSAGSCANGQCGTNSGRRGLLPRLFGR